MHITKWHTINDPDGLILELQWSDNKAQSIQLTGNPTPTPKELVRIMVKLVNSRLDGSQYDIEGK